MERYIYIMAHRLQITLTDEQYDFLCGEAERSSVSIAELIRRSIDTVYGLADFRRVLEIVHSVGRRPGIRLDPRDETV
jgi:hypothetical protein